MPNTKRSATVEWCMHWSEYAEKKDWKPYTLGKINWAAAMAYELSVDKYKPIVCEFLGFRITRYLVSLNLEVGRPSLDTLSAAHYNSISCLKKKKPQTTKPTWNKIAKHKVILYSAAMVVPSLRIKIELTFVYKWACFSSKHAGWWRNFRHACQLFYRSQVEAWSNSIPFMVHSCSWRLYLKKNKNQNLKSSKACFVHSEFKLLI